MFFFPLKLFFESLFMYIIDLEMRQGLNRIILTLNRDFNIWLVFSIDGNSPLEFLDPSTYFMVLMP